MAMPSAGNASQSRRFRVRRVIGALHFLADLTLPYGRVVYDYNKQNQDLAEAAE